ncbi:MAG: hypothetical protein GX868_14835 [Actinobacteria bacterium]|nr:hypothetical protein [Actinomycetota bacterium]
MSTLPVTHPNSDGARHDAAGQPQPQTQPQPAPVTRNRGRAGVEPFQQMLEVVSWHDSGRDHLGYDPRSDYVERFWLGLLGPSTTWLVRRFARGLREHPNGFRVDLVETGRALGLGDSISRNSSLQRSLLRACQFGVFERVSERRVAVRTAIPPLSKRQLERLPETVRQAHDRWQRASVDAEQRLLAEAAAFGMASIGAPIAAVETQLNAWGVAPAIAREAALAAHRR